MKIQCPLCGWQAEAASDPSLTQLLRAHVSDRHPLVGPQNSDVGLPPAGGAHFVALVRALKGWGRHGDGEGRDP